MKLIDGAEIFKLMDSQGLPLEMINLTLRKRGAAFDVVSFVKTALDSGNFTYPIIKARLTEAMIPEAREKFGKEMDKYFNESS